MHDQGIVGPRRFRSTRCTALKQFIEKAKENLDGRRLAEKAVGAALQGELLIPAR